MPIVNMSQKTPSAAHPHPSVILAWQAFPTCFIPSCTHCHHPPPTPPGLTNAPVAQS